MNENFETETGELGKIKHMGNVTGEKILTVCGQTTKIAHTLLIVLLTLIPRRSPGNKTKVCPNYTWLVENLVLEVLWLGTEQDHNALPGSTVSHG